MSDVIEIRNCEIRYACPNNWDGLEITQNAAIRHCSSCERDVHLCRTETELHQAMIDDHCVAIKIHDALKGQETTLLGDIIPGCILPGR